MQHSHSWQRRYGLQTHSGRKAACSSFVQGCTDSGGNTSCFLLPWSSQSWLAVCLLYPKGVPLPFLSESLYPTIGGMPNHVLCNRSHGINLFPEGQSRKKISMNCDLYVDQYLRIEQTNGYSKIGWGDRVLMELNSKSWELPACWKGRSFFANKQRLRWAPSDSSCVQATRTDTHHSEQIPC